MTHAVIVSFGLALARLGVDVRTLTATAPPPHLTLLTLLARVLGGSADVYGDIQRSNPHAATARRALADALRAFDSLIGDADGDGLGDSDGGHRRVEGLDAAFGELRRLMSPELGPYQDRCHELFRTIHHTNDEGETDR
ncbi:hypothetical protein ACQ4WX_17415 [Streptomyces lasalocidi]